MPRTTVLVLHVCGKMTQSQVPDPPWPLVCAKLTQIQAPDQSGPQSLFFMSVPRWRRVKCLIPPDHLYVLSWGRFKHLITPDHSPCSSCLCQDEAESSAWSPLTTHVCAKLRQIQAPDHPRPQSLFFMSVPRWGRAKCPLIPDHCSSLLCWPQTLHLIPGKAITNCLSYLALIAVIPLDRNPTTAGRFLFRTQ